LCIPAIVGMLAWACKETGGGMNTTLIKTGNKISGSAYSWAFLSGMNVRAVMGGLLLVYFANNPTVNDR
jgi:cytosine/uracil/thiamine/allantoin permease